MDSYLFYLTLFNGIVTVALVAQAVILYFAYRRMTRLAGELERIVARLAEQSAQLMTQADDLMAGFKHRIDRYGQVGHEISTRVQHTINNILESVDQVQRFTASGVEVIAREARAVTQAIVQTIIHLGRRGSEQRQLPPPNGPDP